MNNCIWGWGGSQRLLKVIVFFESINCIINHCKIAQPQEMNTDGALRSFHDMLPLASAAVLRKAVFVKGSRRNRKLAILSLRQPAQIIT